MYLFSSFVKSAYVYIIKYTYDDLKNTS